MLKFPTNWKSSKIVPIHKKDDILNPANYRPIAIIPVVSKFLEKAIYIQIFRYLEDNKLIHPSHHAYRPGHNTTTALLQMCDSWIEALESGQMAGVCLLDMSAAFDTVDFDLLLKKLTIYGFREDVISWFRSYLEDRKQCVSINGALSKFFRVNSGVPRGSILGPLLYTLYTNELPEVIHAGLNNSRTGQEKTSNICCFADDTTLSSRHSDHTELTKQLTEQYGRISEFMTDNGLKLYGDKCHLIVITSNQARKKSQSANLVHLKTELKIIKPSSCQKLLGCYLQDDLKWTQYLRDNQDSLLKSLNCRVNAIKKLSKAADFKTRRVIGDGIFFSKLSYVITVWSSCSNELLNALQVVQNKAARTITRNSWEIGTRENLKQIGWLSVYQLSFYHTVLTAHQVKNKGQPEYLCGVYQWDYSYYTRQAREGHLKPIGIPRLEIAKKSF